MRNTNKLALFAITAAMILLADNCSSGNDVLRALSKASEIDNIKRESIKTFNPMGLYDIINGGADFYLPYGLKEGIFTVYKAPDGKKTEIFLEEYGDAESVRKLFNDKLSTINELYDLPGYEPDQVKAVNAISAVNIFGRNDIYYFEIAVTQFKDQLDALSAVKVFLDLFINTGDAI